MHPRADPEALLEGEMLGDLNSLPGPSFPEKTYDQKPRGEELTWVTQNRVASEPEGGAPAPHTGLCLVRLAPTGRGQGSTPLPKGTRTRTEPSGVGGGQRSRFPTAEWEVTGKQEGLWKPT